MWLLPTSVSKRLCQISTRFRILGISNSILSNTNQHVRRNKIFFLFFINVDIHLFIKQLDIEGKMYYHANILSSKHIIKPMMSDNWGVRYSSGHVNVSDPLETVNKNQVVFLIFMCKPETSKFRYWVVLRTWKSNK